jgi:signal-transduction protein with cAMP-binding, CBS, and nucleotidyltransferase domain
MKVKHIMRTNLVSVPVGASIHDAALKMDEHKVGSILVIDKGMKMQGIVTDRDIAIAVAVKGKDPMKACVYDIMSDDVIAVKETDDVSSALRVMSTTNVRRLPVCKNGKVAGIISSSDIASELREEINEFIGLEEAYAKH